MTYIGDQEVSWECIATQKPAKLNWKDKAGIIKLKKTVGHAKFYSYVKVNKITLL